MDDDETLHSSTAIGEEEEINTLAHAKQNLNANPATQIVIDSGCSRHIVGKNFEKYFVSRTNIKPVTLKLPDGKTYTSNEKVSMSLRVHSIQGPKTLKLSDVIFVPTLNQCLISVRQFCMDGYLISFSGDRCRIYTPE